MVQWIWIQALWLWDSLTKKQSNWFQTTLVLNYIGIEPMDEVQGFYRLENKSCRCYMRISCWILTSSVVNAWLRYRKDLDSMKLSKGNESFSGKEKRMSLIKFTMNVSSSLLKNAKLVTVTVDLLQASSKRLLHLNDQEKHLISKKDLQIQNLITLITGLCIEMKGPGAFSAKRKIDGVAQSEKKAHV